MISLALIALLGAAPFDDAMAKARDRYRDADWDGALAALTTAEAAAETDAQKVDVYLCRGVVLANVPDPDRAQAAWEKGLLLDPNAALTLPATPKIQQHFERTKRTVLATLESVRREQNPANEPPPQPEPIVEAPGSRGFPAITIATGAVAVGVLVAGIALAASATGEVQRARQAMWFDEKISIRASAETQANLAYAAFAIAGAAALTALITYFVLR